MKRTIIQDRGVTEVLERSGVSDAELREVENAILRGGGSTIAGTGGLKKIRCGTAGRGKSGSARLIFADYPRTGRVYFLAAFGKNDKANLSKAERNELHTVKRKLDRAMERVVQDDA